MLHMDGKEICLNILELKQAMVGRHNCTLYTLGTWKLPEDVIAELKARNITLAGVGVLQETLPATETAAQDAAAPMLKEEKIYHVKIGKNTTVSISADDIKKRIENSLRESIENSLHGFTFKTGR